MKARPNDTDKEAAALFTPAPGMQVWKITDTRTSGPRIVIEVDEPDDTGLHIRTECGWSWMPVLALDTDDPATVGAMLAQVEEATDGMSVSVHDRLKQRTMSGHPVTRFAVYVENESHTVLAKSGQTLGAALVAAMRALKSTPTR